MASKEDPPAVPTTPAGASRSAPLTPAAASMASPEPATALVSTPPPALQSPGASPSGSPEQRTGSGRKRRRRNTVLSIPSQFVHSGTYEGYLVADRVRITDRKQARALYARGSFGKGELSRGGLQHVFQNPSPRKKQRVPKQSPRPVATDASPAPAASARVEQEVTVEEDLEMQGEEADAAAEKMEEVEQEEEEEKEEEAVAEEEEKEEEAVAEEEEKEEEAVEEEEEKGGGGADDKDAQKEEVPLAEGLLLSMYEAYFLAQDLPWGLGCLRVLDPETKEEVTPEEILHQFRRINPRFDELYLAFRFCVCKGWIVKSSLKNAADFTLYKGGPGYTHADFSLIVASDSAPGAFNRVANWTRFLSTVRVTTGISKRVLLCNVTRKNKDAVDQRASDKRLDPRDFQLGFQLVQRWQPNNANL